MPYFLQQIEVKKQYCHLLQFLPGALRVKYQRANSVAQDEAVCFEPPHLGLHCLQIQLFSSLAH